MASSGDQDSAALARQEQQQAPQSQETTAQQPSHQQQQTGQQPAPQHPSAQLPQAPAEAAHHQQQQAVPNVAQVQSPQQQAAIQRPLGAPASAQQAAVAAAAAAVNVPVNLGQNVGTAPATESLVCQWQGCQERLHTPEALYEHVCERHVGRKSTNNLNLTCGWGNCRTTTVKRDHITSHIRVHVPLKPHKCEFCGKAFKRPQDLKKHVKTHADDSVIIRSPEPNAANRPQNIYHPLPVPGEGKPAHYFEGSLPGGPYGHPAPHYYQPAPPHHPQHPQPPQSYGNVYYAVGSDGSHQTAYENKKRGYDALNEFFGDMKRRQFDPTSYAAVGHRLQSLHGLQLPLVHGGTITEYQQAPTMATVGGNGAYGPGPAPAQSYHLPPMGHLGTKADVMHIDRFLEQMQNTLFENDTDVAASGVAQPGAHYVHGAMSYRPTHSPPTASHHVAAYGATAAAPQSTPVVANSHAARSPMSATPALTPPSSAQSYTSGRSPISMPSTHHSHTGMYPTLPATTAQEHPASGYPAVSSAAPASTLSSAFDHEDRRRYGGGMLQRARVHPGLENGYAGDDIAGYPIASKTSPKTSDSVIDPALRRASDDLHVHSHASDESSKLTASPEASPEAEEKTQVRDQAWVMNVRLLAGLRDWVRAMLEAKEHEHEHGHTEEALSFADQQAQHQHQEGDMETDNGLYPALKMHLDAEDAQNHREQMEMDES